MADDFGFAPPPFNVDNALQQIRRALRPRRLQLPIHRCGRAPQKFEVARGFAVAVRVGKEAPFGVNSSLSKHFHDLFGR